MAYRKNRDLSSNYLRRSVFADRYFNGFSGLMLISLGLSTTAALENAHEVSALWIAGGASMLVAFASFACHLYHHSKIMN
jgi:hypothetical protein